MSLTTSGFAIVLATAALAAMPASVQPRGGYDDPAAYCRAIVNADEVGRDYRGPAVPDWMRRRMGLTRDQTGFLAWRCMNRRVLVCVGGGNVPCDRADTSRVAVREMHEYCAANPGQQMPMSVTGHETIYAWRCAGRTPRIARQIAWVDARGFARSSWRDVTPRARRR